ncbi:MAG TPA: bacteriocin secretion accessory protein [Enterococcus columbae]|nr:bacteriocin secretion accessory protein [Enterococcus columbae]
MDPRYFESAEFYHRRYDNFASKIIIPTFCLFCFLVVFAIFATKEVVVSSTGSIEAYRTITNIQSTSSNKIILNHLKENKQVKKGDLLLEYQGKEGEIQLSTLQLQQKQIKEQIDQIQILLDSLNKEKNLFEDNDAFGYKQTYLDYVQQVETIKKSVQQQNANIQAQNISASQAKQAIQNAMNELQNELNDYQQAKQAILNQTALNKQNAAYTLYQSYHQQMGQENADSIKQQVLSQLDSQIASLENSLSGYKIQYASSGVQQAASDTFANQSASLKAQTIAKTEQEKQSLQKQLTEVENNLQLQQQQGKLNRIYAQTGGVLHIVDTDNEFVSPGTVIAQLYPIITKVKRIKLVSYISARDVTHIQKGMKMRFTAYDSAKDKLVLEAKVQSIDTSATRTKQGNYFKVESLVSVNELQAKQLSYGLEGRVTLITHTTTYLNYFLDKIFNL